MAFTFTVVISTVHHYSSSWGEEGLSLHCGQLGEGEMLDHIKRNSSGCFGKIQMENSHLFTCIELQP